MPETYNCVCICGASYVSENKNDLDGDGRCPPCEVKRQAVIKEVEARVAVLRAKRPPVVKREPPKTGRGGWINARDLML